MCVLIGKAASETMTIYLDEYSTFNSTQELNYNVKQHEVHNNDKLTASNRQVLRFIARYSVKYAGASHLKVQTIADGVDKSVRTIRRALVKLEGLSIIERKETTRPKTGGAGANIIVIQPFMSPRMTDREVDEKASDSNVETRSTEKEPSNKRVNSSNTSETRVTALTHPASLRNSIPTKLYDALAPFFNADDLYKAVGTLYKAKATIDPSINAEDHEEYTDAFHAVMRRYKAGKVGNLFGYLYAAFTKVTRGIVLRRGVEFYA